MAAVAAADAVAKAVSCLPSGLALVAAVVRMWMRMKGDDDERQWMHVAFAAFVD